MLAATAVAEARSFPATAEGIVEIDNWIEDAGKRWGIDERTVFRARICMSELVSNAVEHGHASPESAIDLELRHRPPGLEIELSDAGNAFDPVTATVTTNSEYLGGRGLLLVRSYAKTISYRRNGSRNVVTLQLVPSV